MRGRGVYVNELDADEGNDRFRLTNAGNYRRLVESKYNKYDSTNLFRANVNVKLVRQPSSERVV